MELQVEPKVNEFVTGQHRLLIDGDWVDSASGKTFETINPATEEHLADIAWGEAEDIDRAVRAARRAFADGSPWRKMSASARGRLIFKISELIEDNADELAALEALDNGKPMAVAKAADVALAADLFRYMAGWPTKIEGNTIPVSAVVTGGEFLGMTLREPVGVVGQIIPWNFPLLMAAWKLGPVLAAGCTVVLKPAEQTPLSALRLGELMLEAGLPDGVVNIVTGFGDAGAALAAHDDVDKVAFTGSTEVGKMIVEAAVGQPQEGHPRARRQVAERGLQGRRHGPGHPGRRTTASSSTTASAATPAPGSSSRATSTTRSSRASRSRPGTSTSAAAWTPTPTMGPLVSDEQFEKVLGYLEQGREAGAEAYIGGSRVGNRGYFVEPTILTNTSPDMSVVREEIFGPVVTAIPFDDPEQVLPDANDTNYGLAAGVFTRDISKAYKTAKRLRAGTVWVNCYHVFDAAMPFGGYKESGWGREMGHNVLDNYLETKSVVTAL